MMWLELGAITKSVIRASISLLREFPLGICQVFHRVVGVSPEVGGQLGTAGSDKCLDDLLLLQSIVNCTIARLTTLGD